MKILFDTRPLHDPRLHAIHPRRYPAVLEMSKQSKTVANNRLRPSFSTKKRKRELITMICHRINVNSLKVAIAYF